MENQIRANIEKIKEKIKQTAERVGRNPNDITLVGVSKTYSADVVQHAVDAGIKILGENKVQELLGKIPQINGGVKWHIIGHLQSNKVRKIIGLVDLIHSVDTISLAKEIDKVSGKNGIVTNILVQVNTSGEETKFGCEPEETLSLIKQISLLDHVKIRGLMTIGKFSDDIKEVRACFVMLREIFKEINNAGIEKVYLEHLSMGMTNDFETAIEEGATILRIGTAIFGKRFYS